MHVGIMIACINLRMQLRTSNVNILYKIYFWFDICYYKDVMKAVIILIFDSPAVFF